MKSMSFPLFLIIGLVISSTINQTKLNSLQSKHIYNLLKGNKLELVFEFQQHAHSTGALFKMRHGGKTVLSLVSERKDESVIFSVQTNSELYRTDLIDFDSEYHRLSLFLTGNQFQLNLDCSIIAKGEYETNLKEERHKKASIEVGFGSHSNIDFPGRIREFSADLPDKTQLKCPEVNVVHTRVHRSSLSSSSQEGENQVETEQLNDEDGRQVVNSPPSALIDLDQRLHFLESQFQTFREFIHSLDFRLKSVELHQRGCVLNGKHVLSFGEKHQNLGECAECLCSANGQLTCGPIGCAHLRCSHPIQLPGKCCPECGKQCYYNGGHYEHGQEIWPKQCVRCRCENGRMECKFHKPEHCPRLRCDKQGTPPNQCCPVCTDIDYCSSQTNPCHLNATCENRQFGPQCTCKQGFFGNGTTCYDIDECLWDDVAREQLGGCQTGTICINLPGSFKCDCLPGFRRLDDRNCLDIIRF